MSAGLLEAMRDAKRIAVDTEADSYHHFHHKICLIQVAVEGRCWIVDPGWAGFIRDGVDNGPKTACFHDADMTFGCCFRILGFVLKAGYLIPC